MPHRELAWVFCLGLSFGAAGESLLLAKAQCRRVAELLLEDFRVLAFLTSDLPDPKADVLREKLLAVAGVESARYVSRETALRELSARDPELVRSVAFLGESPLLPAFELRLSPEAVAEPARWTQAARGLPDVGEIRYKPAEAAAVVQAQFYDRWLGLALGLAGFAWCLGGAAGLAFAGKKEDGPAWKARLPPAGAAGLGAALGMLLAYAALWPMGSARWWASPGFGAHLLLAAAGLLGGLSPAARRTS